MMIGKELVGFLGKLFIEKFRYNKKIREKQRKQVYKSACNWTVGKLLYLIELALDMFEC